MKARGSRSVVLAFCTHQHTQDRYRNKDKLHGFRHWGGGALGTSALPNWIYSLTQNQMYLFIDTYTAIKVGVPNLETDLFTNVSADD